MLKMLLVREKREDLKEYIEVVFAAATIISFAVSRVKKCREEKDEPVPSVS